MRLLIGLAALAIYTAIFFDMKKNMEDGEEGDAGDKPHTPD